MARMAGLTGALTCASLCAFLATAPLAFAQGAAAAATAAPAVACPDASLAAYDVSSVKPSNTQPRFVGLQQMPDGIHTETVTVAMMVQQAYGSSVGLPTDDAVSGLPDWAKMPYYFAVDAKLSPEQTAALKALDKDQQRACRRTMLRALLADRFNLKVHSQTRQVLAYELVVDKGGPKFKVSTGEPDPNAPMLPNGQRVSKGYMSIVPSNGGQQLVVHNFPMAQLAGLLASQGSVDHKVVDKTGLTGAYTYTLSFAVGGVGPAGGSADATAPDPGPTVFQALPDQLGLRLQRGTETVDTVVVDHVERPSAN